MKRLFTVLLAVLLTGCTAAEQLPTEPTEEIAIEKNEPFNIMVKTHFFQEREGYKTVFESEIDTIILDEATKEKYPLLAKSVEAENNVRKENVEHDFNELPQYAREEYLSGWEYFSSYTTNLYAYVKRCDEKVLSVSYCYDTYTGGMHPNYAYEGTSFDPESGKKLTLGDVFTDVNALPEIIRAELLEKYEEDTFFDIETEEFKSLTQDNTTSWTIGYDRVTFYFSPYELAPYAAGLITAEVFFDEYGEIINEKYKDIPDGYIVEITDDWQGFVCDVNPLEEGRDIINISPEYQDDMYSGIILEINGNGYRHENWFYNSREFFVHLKEDGANKNYIYVETISDNDYPTILVFNVNDKNISFAGQIQGTGLVDEYESDGRISNAFTNPYNFILGTRMDMFSTYSGLKNYYLDFNTGLPVSEMEYYNIDVDYVLTNRIPVSVLIFPEMTKEIITEGESFTFLRTDNETYVDMKLSDLREVRVMVEIIDGWATGLEGKPSWDVFDGTRFAG